MDPELQVLSQYIASWPSLSSVASTIGSRQTGHIVELSPGEGLLFPCLGGVAMDTKGSTGTAK